MKKSAIVLLALSSMWAAPATRSVIHRDGVAIEVIAQGRGPLLILLPSLGRDSEEFDPVAEQMAAAGFRVLRPQPRGFGQRFAADLRCLLPRSPRGLGRQESSGARSHHGPQGNQT